MEQQWMYILGVIIIIIIVGLIIFAFARWNQNSCSTIYVNLRDQMRNLWLEHVYWTREYIIANLEDSCNVKMVAERLLQNQKDLGKFFAQYFGVNVGNEVEDLLTEHILIAVDIINAAKTKSHKLDAYIRKWYKNADEIAAALAGLKVGTYEELKAMMNEHLYLTIEEVKGRLRGDGSDILAFEKVRNEILVMADNLTNGVARVQCIKICTVN